MHSDAQADAVAAYRETTRVPAEDQLLDDMPVGSVLMFGQTLLPHSCSVSFVMTHLLCTTHTATLSSRAGLSLTYPVQVLFAPPTQ